jgi:hypothetical protein
MSCIVHSVHAQVPAAAGSSSLRADAAVNAANVMCSLADLVGGQEGYSLLQQAVQLYRSALEQEEDAAVSAVACFCVLHWLVMVRVAICSSAWPCLLPQLCCLVLKHID